MAIVTPHTIWRLLLFDCEVVIVHCVTDFLSFGLHTCFFGARKNFFPGSYKPTAAGPKVLIAAREVNGIKRPFRHIFP